MVGYIRKKEDGACASGVSCVQARESYRALSIPGTSSVSLSRIIPSVKVRFGFMPSIVDWCVEILGAAMVDSLASESV